jgi:hypothetical protein
MLQGSVQIRVVENDKMKVSKTIDENDMFGFRESLGQKRNDFCTAVNDGTIAIVFDTARYKQLVNENMYSKGEMKIDFLMRYGPMLRIAGRRCIEQFEIFFIKERVTKGY